MGTIEPAPSPVAEWRAPAWAERSKLEDAGVWHSAERRMLQRLDSNGVPVALSVTADAFDVVDVVDGRVEVRRDGEPTIRVETLHLTLAQADQLGRALIAFAERIERDL